MIFDIVLSPHNISQIVKVYLPFKMHMYSIVDNSLRYVRNQNDAYTSVNHAEAPETILGKTVRETVNSAKTEMSPSFIPTAAPACYFIPSIAAVDSSHWKRIVSKTKMKGRKAYGYSPVQNTKYSFYTWQSISHYLFIMHNVQIPEERDQKGKHQYFIDPNEENHGKHMAKPYPNYLRCRVG